MDQLLLHLWGDYILQSHWVALNKSKVFWVCAVHCVLYTLPFLLLTHSWQALAVIAATHFVIDRWGLARYLIWAKNWVSAEKYAPWRWCRMTGYFDPEVAKAIPAERVALALMTDNPEANRPIWIRVWLLIITDNALHLTCNFMALRWLE